MGSDVIGGSSMFVEKPNGDIVEISTLAEFAEIVEDVSPAWSIRERVTLTVGVRGFGPRKVLVLDKSTAHED